MDNNELDKILKQKLNSKIKPSLEMQEKIREKVEIEKKARYAQQSKTEFTKIENASNKYKRLTSLISIAAMLIVIFTVGITLNQDLINPENADVNLVTIKAIEPTKLKNGIIENDSEFIIYAEGENINKESVQKSIYVDPPLDYTIEKTSNKNQYKLKFKQNIPDNTIVKLQYVKDLITEDSWAYQTSNKLSVTKTYPNVDSLEVSKKSVIEIEFSYASIENLENYVQITPNTEGTWEHLGKIWRFTPKKGLEDGTKYTVSVKKGITAEEQTLENDYIFNFYVNESEDYSTLYEHASTAIDGISTFKPDENIKIYYENYSEKSSISKVEIRKFENTNEFMQYLQTKNYENSESQGEYKFTEKENYIQLNKSLQNGYYVAIIKNQKEKELFNCPIQINDLSAYAIESERDVLVWVADEENLAKDIKVEYSGKEQKTNAEGIAKFENVADNSETIKYVNIGNTDNKLVVGIYNYNLENYPTAYLYTDRPLYKNTDTINIWGFVPRDLFYDKIEDEFYIELNDEGKQKVEVDKDGVLNYKIDLNNHTDCEYGGITLYYKDNQIGYREIEIKKYELQNYIYEPIIDRNYVYSGDNFEFDVKVKHVTGLVVANKKVAITCYANDGTDKTIIKTTGEDGIAHFSIPVVREEDEYILRTEPSYFEISIYNGDAEEYIDAEEYFGIYVLKRDTYTKIEEPEEHKFKVTLYKLASDKNVDTTYELKEIYDGIYDTTVQINLIESVTKRYVTGYTYNEYTKQNEPEYEYDMTENTKKIKTITTENGIFEFDANSLNYKKDTEDISYSYSLEFIYKDRNDREVKETVDIYFEEDYLDYIEELGYHYNASEYELYSSSDLLYEAGLQINELYYYTYRYLLKENRESFSIGDTINFTLAESTNSGIKDIQNEGKLLKIVLQEDITETQIIEDNNITYTFKEKDFPGCKITAAYFYKGNFYRLPIYYYDFDEQDRKVDIEITADKEEYKPGDEVTLTVKTTNNGNPVKSSVNISVANEAVFLNTDESETNILETIYYNKNYPIYTYSSYGDYIYRDMGGGGGGDGEIRGDFGDTAYFGTVKTDSKGIAKVTFTLPDNVTTYRVTAHSANKDLYVGSNKTEIVSKLDFFVQSTEPRNVKTTDDLVLNATSISEEKYNVDYEFTIKELNKTMKVSGFTNEMVTANFGKLPLGTYHAIIKGSAQDRTDAIEYEFNIVESTQEIPAKTTININNETTIKPTKNPIVLEIYNKNMSKYLKYIDFIESTLTERLDTQIAYNEIQNIKAKYYGTENIINYVDLSKYKGEEYLKNLENEKDDIVLTALTSYYTKQYANSYFAKGGLDRSLTKDDNIFEFYLLAAANNEPVLTDLLYLKDETDIDNYNKLLVTLSLEFLGDFQNAKELYSSIDLTDSESEEYKSIIAIIDTFINKKEADSKIDNLIKNKPADEYLRFAILSYFQNISAEIENESTVKITSANLNETITINGMQVKTYTINNEDLNNINFETNNNDLMVSYYYQTLIDNIEDEDISKDIKININGELKKRNTVTLNIDFKGNYEGDIRIALPNSLRLAYVENKYYYDKEYYIQNNQIDYITIYKTKKCKNIELSLIVTLDGEYKFENVVCCNDGKYHISNSLDIEITK